MPGPRGRTGYLGAIEVERLVNAVGRISVAGRSVPIGTPLAGRRVTLRRDGTLPQVIDDGTLLRSLPFPLTRRPARPHPRLPHHHAATATASPPATPQRSGHPALPELGTFCDHRQRVPPWID